MQTALTRIMSHNLRPLALHSIDEGGTETLTKTAYSIQRDPRTEHLWCVMMLQELNLPF